jgi:Domain of unknown function (DUF4326)
MVVAVSILPRRVQLSRAQGWRMPPNTVSVARPGVWGNHYRVGDSDGTGGTVRDAAHAVELYSRWLCGPSMGDSLARLARERLGGKNLACWCRLDAPRHADLLLHVANRPIDPPTKPQLVEGLIHADSTREVAHAARRMP